MRKVSEMRDGELDALVSVIIGARKGLPSCYSSRWEHGGPIIEREFISIHPKSHDLWQAQMGSNNPSGAGETPLLAAMRCFVAVRIGEDVA